MKRFRILLTGLALLFLVACGTESGVFQPGTSPASPVASEQPMTFVDQLLSESYTPILSLYLPEDGDRVIRYTYDTDGAGPIALLLTAESGAETCFSLPATEEDAYNTLWMEETFPLEAGYTTLSAMGDGVHLTMKLQVDGENTICELPSPQSRT